MAGFQNATGGITQLTGDGTAGPGVGSQVLTLVATTNTAALVNTAPMVAIYNNATQN
jgi:hypothetical protein